MGGMSGMITGFIDLIINFFEGIKNLFNGSSEKEELSETTDVNSENATQDKYLDEESTEE